MMKRYCVELQDIGKSSLVEEDIDISDLKENEAVIKAEYSLISAGTELSRAYGLKKGFSYPVRPGYSLVGRIVAAGEGTGFREGERVFANCPHASLVRWSSGDDVQGPLILKVPEEMDPRQATLINITLVAIQGVDLTDIRPGYHVAVFGLGTIGILTALIYRKAGCEVTGIDPVGYRCRLAEQAGIPETLTDAGGLEDRQFDICVDASGLSPVIIDCISHTAPYGQTLLLGSPRLSCETDITPVLSQIHMKDLRVIGAFNRTVPVNEVPGSRSCMMRNLKRVCDMMMNKDIPAELLISRIVDPADCQKAYEDLMYKKEDSSCIIFDWDRYANSM